VFHSYAPYLASTIIGLDQDFWLYILHGPKYLAIFYFLKYMLLFSGNASQFAVFSAVWFSRYFEARLKNHLRP